MRKSIGEGWAPRARFPVLLIIGALSGCSTTIEFADANRRGEETLYVVTKSSERYQIGSGWTADSAHGITGRGLVSRGDSTKLFRGTIPINEIARLSVQDDFHPALLIISGVPAVSLLIYIRP